MMKPLKRVFSIQSIFFACALTVWTAVESAFAANARIRVNGNDTVLNWESELGATYAVEQNASIASNGWQTIATNLAANSSGTNEFIITNALVQWPARFFRVSTGAMSFTFSWTGTNFTYSDATRTFDGIMLKPPGPGPFPAVIIHHGAGGTATGYSLPKAREMSAWGMACIAPTLTHTAGGETNPVNMGFCPENLARTTACLGVLLGLPYVDTNRLAIFGHSMGAFATIGDAAALPGRFRAASITSGGIIPDAAGTANAAPTVTEANPDRTPFIMFYCDADPVVPPMRSQLFQQVLNSNSVPNLRILYSSNSISNPSNWHNIHQDTAINADLLTNTFQWFRSQGVLP
jgi:Dienelactone hydrolase and related enzymes